MSDKDEPKDDSEEREEDDDTKEDDEEESDDEPEEREAAAAGPEKSGRSSETKERTASQGSRRDEGRGGKRAPVTIGTPRAVLIGVVALAAGGTAGWFGHIEQAKAKTRGETVSTTRSGACGSWQQKVCASSGADSAACQQAKGAADLLTASACEVALEAMPATLAKVKSDRAPCDKLVGRLCADLTPGSQICNLIKEQTPKFGRQRCDEMSQNYDQVLMEVRALEQQQAGMRMGHGPGDGHGHPPGQGMPGDPHGH